MKNHKDLIRDLQRHQSEIRNFVNQTAPRLVAQKALEIFDESWNRQGFTNASGGFEPWEQRKENTGAKSDTRGILIGKGSAKLRRSLRVIGTPTPSKIVIGTAVPYAKIHNEGGTISIPITEAMRNFFWAKYYEQTGKATKLTPKANRRIRPKRTERLNTDKSSAQKWKNLALTKKQTLTITMPKRKFMGDSALLKPAIDLIITKGLNEILKK